MDALKQFLESIKSNHRELIIIFFGFVFMCYSVFLICDLVFDVLKFEGERMLKKYFTFRQKKDR
jgi:hypothetical protein